MNTAHANPQCFVEVIQTRIDCQLETSPWLLRCLLQSSLNGGVEIFKSSKGNILGYVAWAKVTRYALNASARSQCMPPYLYEWQEGRITMIYDIVINRRWAREGHYAFYMFIMKKRFFAYLNKGKLVMCIRQYKKRKFKRIKNDKLQLYK